MKQKLKYAYSYYFSAPVQNIPDKNKYCAGTLVLDRQKIVRKLIYYDFQKIMFNVAFALYTCTY